ncbi:MAG: polyphosphate kinase 2, partial [Proteobacteria bacterium]|nr:polyphosphate kinase 2 [Pseudomonadota bacterium]
MEPRVTDQTSSNKNNGTDNLNLTPAPSPSAVAPVAPHEEPVSASALHELAEMRRDPDAIRELFLSGKYPYQTKIPTREYERKKKALQVELLKVQRWVKETGQKIVVLFEGRDAAGKGGTIKRFMEHLNPRGARVVALEKPSELEKGQWYFQ